MAEFYGRLQGNRGEATRCGSKDSGIHTTAESWTSVIRTHQTSDGAAISVEQKYGGTVLYMEFDADRIVEQSGNESVKVALARVNLAIHELDKAAKNTEAADQALRQAREAGEALAKAGI